MRPLFGFETAQWTADGKRVLVKILAPGTSVQRANAISRQPRSSAEAVKTGVTGPAVTVRRANPATAAAPSGPASATAGRVGAPAWTWAAADLALVEPGSGAITRFAEQLPVRSYALSPDGNLIAYMVMTGGEPNSQQTLFDLIVHPIEGGSPRTLATGVRLEVGSEWNWSPDSRRVAVISSGQL